MTIATLPAITAGPKASDRNRKPSSSKRASSADAEPHLPATTAFTVAGGGGLIGKDVFSLSSLS